MNLQRGRRAKRWALGGLGLLVLLAPAAVLAHARDLVGLELKVRGGKVEEELVLSIPSLASLAPVDADGDGRLTQADLDAEPEAVFLATLGQAPLTADGVRCPLKAAGARLEAATVRIRGEGHCPLQAVKLRQSLDFLSSLPEGHHAVVGADLDGERHESVADRATRVLVFERQKPQGIGSFVLLGLEHIFTGYDHLLFLVALLLAGGSLRRLLAVVTSFTVAHSITLALAALSLVNLPSRLVEIVIAASIVYVAVENFFVKAPRYRWAVAFGFGLVHGFGFASILGEMNLGRHGVVRALVGFNLGVEAGQLAVVVAVAPLIAWARRRPGFLRVGVPALSLLIMAAGSYWLALRALVG